MPYSDIELIIALGIGLLADRTKLKILNSFITLRLSYMFKITALSPRSQSVNVNSTLSQESYFRLKEDKLSFGVKHVWLLKILLKIINLVRSICHDKEKLIRFLCKTPCKTDSDCTGKTSVGCLILRVRKTVCVWQCYFLPAIFPHSALYILTQWPAWQRSQTKGTISNCLCQSVWDIE